MGGGGGGYVRNKHTGYCAPCRLVFSIIVFKFVEAESQS